MTESPNLVQIVPEPHNDSTGCRENSALDVLTRWLVTHWKSREGRIVWPSLTSIGGRSCPGRFARRINAVALSHASGGCRPSPLRICFTRKVLPSYAENAPGPVSNPSLARALNLYWNALLTKRRCRSGSPRTVQRRLTSACRWHISNCNRTVACPCQRRAILAPASNTSALCREADRMTDLPPPRSSARRRRGRKPRGSPSFTRTVEVGFGEAAV